MPIGYVSAEVSNKTKQAYDKGKIYPSQCFTKQTQERVFLLVSHICFSRNELWNNFFAFKNLIVLFFSVLQMLDI